MNLRHFFLVSAVAVVTFALAGCAAGPGATGTPGITSAPTSAPTVGPTAAGGATTVNVTLQEFAVIPDVASAPTGDIRFVVTNTGPDDIHEFVIVQTDLAPDALPTDDTGAVDEEGDGMTVIDEVEDLEVAAVEELTVNLAAGNYVLICNIYDEDEDEAHYEMGMYTGFTVTE